MELWELLSDPDRPVWVQCGTRGRLKSRGCWKTWKHWTANGRSSRASSPYTPTIENSVHPVVGRVYHERTIGSLLLRSIVELVKVPCNNMREHIYYVRGRKIIPHREERQSNGVHRGSVFGMSLKDRSVGVEQNWACNICKGIHIQCRALYCTV